MLYDILISLPVHIRSLVTFHKSPIECTTRCVCVCVCVLVENALLCSLSAAIERSICYGTRQWRHNMWRIIYSILGLNHTGTLTWVTCIVYTRFGARPIVMLQHKGLSLPMLLFYTLYQPGIRGRCQYRPYIYIYIYIYIWDTYSGNGTVGLIIIIIIILVNSTFVDFVTYAVLLAMGPMPVYCLVPDRPCHLVTADELYECICVLVNNKRETSGGPRISGWWMNFPSSLQNVLFC